MSAPKTPAEMLDALGKPFPPNAIKRKQGKFDYVEHQTVTRRLNSIAPDWSFVIRETWFRDDLHMTNKNGDSVLTMVVLGELTIPGLGTRSGYGVANLQPGGGEDQYKGAESDALKKAASRFGVALDLYGDDYEAEADAPAQPQRPQPQRAPQRATRPPAAPNPAHAMPPAAADRDALLTRLRDKAPDHLLNAVAVRWDFANVEALPLEALQDLDALLDLKHPSKSRQEGFNAFKALHDAEHQRTQAQLMPTPDEVPDPDRHTL